MDRIRKKFQGRMEQRTTGPTKLTEPGDHRKRLGCLRIATALVIVCLWLTNYLDLLHIGFFDYGDVEISRFMLHRWPRNRQELDKSEHDFFQDKYMDSGRQYDSVEIVPLAGDACIVTVHFHNLIGIPYVEKKELVWSAEKMRRIRQHYQEEQEYKRT